MQKPERNDPCSCGSGKKFKKCCQMKMHRGRFKAEAISADSSMQAQKTAGLVSFLNPVLSGSFEENPLSKRMISPVKSEPKTKHS